MNDCKSVSTVWNKLEHISSTMSKRLEEIAVQSGHFLSILRLFLRQWNVREGRKCIEQSRTNTCRVSLEHDCGWAVSSALIYHEEDALRSLFHDEFVVLLSFHVIAQDTTDIFDFSNRMKAVAVCRLARGRRHVLLGYDVREMALANVVLNNGTILIDTVAFFWRSVSKINPFFSSIALIFSFALLTENSYHFLTSSDSPHEKPLCFLRKL